MVVFKLDGSVLQSELKKKILTVWPCFSKYQLTFYEENCTSHLQQQTSGGAICLTTRAWRLQSVLKQGFVVGVYITLEPQQTVKQSLATKTSPQITTSEIRNLRHGIGELAGICSLETTIRQVRIIFPAVKQAATVL